MTVRIDYVSFWIVWVFVAGALLFLPGVVVYVWDFFFGMRPDVPGYADVVST